MNFLGINSIFNSQGLKVEFKNHLSFLWALKLLIKENQLQRPLKSCQTFDSEKNGLRFMFIV